MNNIEKITFFLGEAKRQQVEVLGPDVNESSSVFDVNKAQKVRFGLTAIKGTGEAAVGEIIREREEKGLFKSIFDFCERVNLSAVNKKTFESLAMAGAFDSLGLPREVYFAEEEGSTFLEKLIRYGNAIQAEKLNAQQSLFGGIGSSEVLIPTPKVPQVEAWSNMEKLKKEKEVVGFYISGHPLDLYKMELSNFCSCSLDQATEPQWRGKEVSVGGIVSNVQIRQGKNGAYFTLFTLEDYQGSQNMALFGSDHVKMGNFIQNNAFLFIKAAVQKRYNSDDQWELKPLQIQLLSEIKQQKVKGLTLFLDIHQLDLKLFDTLESTLQAHPGKALLRMQLADNKENIQLNFFSRKYHIAIEEDLFRSLEQIAGVSYKIIS